MYFTSAMATIGKLVHFIVRQNAISKIQNIPCDYVTNLIVSSVWMKKSQNDAQIKSNIYLTSTISGYIFCAFNKTF